MNTAEFREAFFVGYDAKANFAAPGYEDSEVSFLLTKAELVVTQGFVRAKKYDNIIELIRTEKFMLTNSNLVERLGECAYQTTTPSDFLFMEHIRSRLLVKQRTEVVVITDRWVECQLVSQNNVDKFIQTITNQPLLIYPKVLLHISTTSDFTQVLPIVLIDKYTGIDTSPVPNTFELTYVRVPGGIDITTEVTSLLNPLLHQLIVNVAVADAIVTSDSSRVSQSQQPQRSQQQPSESDE